MTRSAVRVGAMVGALVLVAACSGGDEAAQATTTVASTVPSTVVTTTEATTSSTTVPTDPATSTTAAPTTTVEPSTTVEPTAPTTTSLPDGVPPRVTFPDDPEKQAVVDAAYAFFDAARAAQAAPEDEMLRAALAETMVDPIATRMVAFLDQLVADGQRIVGNQAQPTFLDVNEATVFAADGSGIFDACAVDADVRVAADGSVVDDDIVSSSVTYSLELGGGSWRVREFAIYQSWEDQAQCG